MVPLQLIFLMMLVLLPTSMNGGHLPPAPGEGWKSLAWMAATIGLTHAGLVLFAWQRTGRYVRLLDDTSVSATAVTSRMDAMMSKVRWITVALAALQVWGMGWGETVNHGLAQTVLLKFIPLVAPVLFAAPAILTWTLLWGCQYSVERAVRQRSMAYLLAQGLPSHDMPSLARYVWMQVRHNLYLLVPVAIATSLEHVAGLLNSVWAYSSAVAVPIVVFVLVLLAPWIVTRIWETVVLEGPLRERLERLAAMHRLGYREIYVWRTGSMVTNAAILGYVPMSRYFLMTDALLETLSDRQIEAVFAHEVGHGVHKHIWWYAFAVGGWFLIAAALGEAVALQLPAQMVILGYSLSAEGVAVGLTLLLLGLFLRFGFSLVSRRFEHQADWFAAKHMGQSLEAEPLERRPRAVFAEVPSPVERMSVEEYLRGEAGQSPREGPVLEGTAVMRGAEMFNSALETLVDTAHRSRKKAGWMHPSVDDRLALLKELAGDAEAEAAFERKMVLTRVMIVVIFAGGVVAVGLPELMGWLRT